MKDAITNATRNIFLFNQVKVYYIRMSPSKGCNIRFRIIHSNLLALCTQTHCSRSSLVTSMFIFT